MLLRLHVTAAALALVTISTFWTGTVVSELFLSQAWVTNVKTAVLWGMVLLVPAMATAGITGAVLGKGWKLPQVARKARRMKVIAANGLLILLPAATFLAVSAQAGAVTSLFYGVQALELVAGATNICLLGLNMKDGMSLRARRRK